MKKLSHNLMITAGKVDGQTARLVLFVLSLAMFVIAAGAPECGGTVGF